jgi:hypothetical protein
MANASVALITARTLLNDDAGTLWSDTVLLPKLQQAHRELQAELWFSGSPVLRKMSTTVTIAAGVLVHPGTGLTDMVEPIRLEEKGTAEADSLFVPMTEYDPLPTLAQATTLKFWQWSEETIKFLGSSVDRSVRVYFRKSLTVPAVAGDSLGFTMAELYLAPRTAALAFGSTGNMGAADAASTLADKGLIKVILSNKGRMRPAEGATQRP